MFDLLLEEDFLDLASREAILSELRTAGAQPAVVYGQQAGGAVDTRVRSTKRLVVAAQTRALVISRLMERKTSIAAHFGVELNVCEEPQFLRYQAGDFFVAHQDGNTPLILDASRLRKISVIVFLSAPDTYEGGSLVFHGKYPDADIRQTLRAHAGSLVAFRSETTHEVTPVIRGERYSIASWYR